MPSSAPVPTRAEANGSALTRITPAEKARSRRTAVRRPLVEKVPM